MNTTEPATERRVERAPQSEAASSRDVTSGLVPALFEPPSSFGGRGGLLLQFAMIGDRR